MAGYRYMLATLKYFKNVVPVVPSQSPLCKSPHSLLQLNNIVSQSNKICTDCPVYDNIQNSHSNSTGEYKWNDTVLLIVGALKGIDENVMRMSLKEGVKQVANLHTDKAYGETMQSMFCHEFKDGNIVKYINCDITNEPQLINRLQLLMRSNKTSHVVVNDINFLGECNSKEDIDANLGIFMKSSLTAFDLMRTDKDGNGGAIINLVAMSSSCYHTSMPVCEATKSMDLNLSSDLGLDYERFFHKTGVRVMTICYGPSDATLKTDDKTGAIMYPTVIEALQTSNQIIKSAAKAVIDIFKVGENGTTWLSRETEPIEDVTLLTKKAISSISSKSEPELKIEATTASE